jgi:hypothetical protein
MAILKIKQIVWDLEHNTSQVVGTLTKANSGTSAVASSAAQAGTALKATSAGYAGTSYRATIANYGSSGTAALAGTGAWWNTSGIQGNV